MSDPTVIVVNSGGDDDNNPPPEPVAEPAVPVEVAIEQAEDIAHLEDAVAVQGAVIAELADQVSNAQVTADVALDTAVSNAEALATVDEVIEEAIEEATPVDVDGDGTVDELDAPDVAPIGARTHWLDRSWAEWKERLFS